MKAFLRLYYKEVFVPLEVNCDIQAAGYPNKDGSIAGDVIGDPKNLGIWRFLRKAKREQIIVIFPVMNF